MTTTENLEIRIWRNVTIGPSSKIVSDTGESITARECVMAPFEQRQANCRNYHLPRTHLKGKYLYLGGSQAKGLHHGHQLIETLSRWWILLDKDREKIFDDLDGIIVSNLFPRGRDSANVSVAISKEIGLASGKNKIGQNVQNIQPSLKWILSFLVAFIDNNPILVGKPLIFAEQNTTVDTLIIPQILFRHKKSFVVEHIPYLSRIYGHIRDFWKNQLTNIDTYERIYISRGNNLEMRLKTPSGNPMSRLCRNERDIEEFFRTQGFQIFYFETLPIGEQICLSANCKFMAGFQGTNIHNILFCEKKTNMIVLGDIISPNLPFLTQTRCNLVTDARATFVQPIFTEEDKKRWVFSVDMENLKKNVLASLE